MPSYTIQSGDTLYGIARRFGVSAATIAAANNISNPNLIRAGASLDIPTGARVSAKAEQQFRQSVVSNPLPTAPQVPTLSAAGSAVPGLAEYLRNVRAQQGSVITGTLGLVSQPSTPQISTKEKGTRPQSRLRQGIEFQERVLQETEQARQLAAEPLGRRLLREAIERGIISPEGVENVIRQIPAIGGNLVLRAAQNPANKLLGPAYGTAGMTGTIGAVASTTLSLGGSNPLPGSLDPNAPAYGPFAPGGALSGLIPDQQAPPSAIFGSEQARGLTQSRVQELMRAGYSRIEAERIAAGEAQIQATTNPNFVNPNYAGPFIESSLGVPGAPDAFGTVGGAILDVRDLPEEIVRRETPRFTGPEFYRGGSEQAVLGPVAQAEAFFLGDEGERWQLGAFYSGLDPESRNPPAFISPYTYRVLTESVDEERRVSPEIIGRLYERDPVTGFYVRKSGAPPQPLAGGYGGFGGGPGGGFGGFGRGGTGGFGGRNTGAMQGLVMWRIGL